MHDEHDNVILGGYPGAFREVCGMRMEEMVMIPDGRDVRVVFGSGEGEGEDAEDVYKRQVPSWRGTHSRS